jgi:aminopeptidase N
VWAGRRPDGRVFAVVAADDADALTALHRPLPHYGWMSYLAFDGAKALLKGIWPAGDSPLRRNLAAPG